MGRRALSGCAPRKAAIWRVLPALSLVFTLSPAERVAAARISVDAAGSVRPDPFERANRRIYAISKGFDRAVLGPVAHGYIGATPAVLRNRVSTFIYNLGEPKTALNDALQGRPAPAGRAVGRLVINTTVGLGGLFDVASQAGVAGSQADFGQTLGRYGVRTGPYLFVPFLGPSDVRDSVGALVDVVSDPVAWATGGLNTIFAAARGGITALDARAQADSAIRALDDATDPYATARSAYLQNRAAVIDSARGRAPALPDFDAPPGPSETSASE
jgi:phospholipid-binding lipoprotein MlaA